MLREHNFKPFGKRLMPFMRAAALPAALGTLWHITGAFGQEAQKAEPPAAPSSAFTADEAPLPRFASKPRAAASASNCPAGQPEEAGVGSCRARSETGHRPARRQRGVQILDL
jgi:hypothetical protein